MKLRYHDGLPEPVKRGFRLAERVRGIAKAHRIDVRVATERFVAESILWALTEVSETPFVVKGGLLHRQTERQTGDADIMLMEPVSAVEIYGDVGAAARLLRQHGIMWTPGEVRPMSMGGRGQGFRVPVVAKLGATRVDTHVDVSFGALPEGSVKREFRSMFKGPSFVAWAQPLEAQAADKLAAIATLGMDNTRLKDYRDLLLLRRIGLDDEAIARHLYQTMRERKADTAVLLGIPDGLSLEYAEARQWEWRAYAAQSAPGLPLDFLWVVCHLRHWFADVMDRWHALAERDQLEPRSHVLRDGNVYSLEAYRHLRAAGR